VTGCGPHRGWVIAVRSDFGAREVSVAGMLGYTVGIEYAIKIVTAASAAPVEQTNEEGDKQSTNSACDTAHNCTSTTAAATTSNRC
jgi:hypothetical protein